MPSPDRANVIHLSRSAWWGLALLVLAPWVVVLWWIRETRPAPAARSTAAPPTAVAATRGPGPSQPWGRLETLHVMIEPPEALVSASYGDPQPLRWTFKHTDAAALEALWQRAGLTPFERQSLDGPGRIEVVGADSVVHPDPSFVSALTPGARTVIYSALAPFKENAPQNEPFRVPNDRLDQWFDNSGVAPATIAATKRLLYPRDGIMFFSDHDLVLPQLPSATERVRFLKAASRKSALLVRLHVDRDSDIERLTLYWGRGRRSKDIEPLLQSLANHPGGADLDIVHLLPRFARSLLYTYPVPHQVHPLRDCHWTSFNFHNEQPDERFLDIEAVRQTLLEHYFPVTGDLALGDLILLVRPDGVVVHSCVHIADHIVFTKNGPSFSVPWVLNRLDYVTAFYSRGEPLEVRRYRARD